MIDYVANKFDLSLHIEDIRNMQTAKEILDYLSKLEFPYDDYYNEDVIPMIQKLVEVEKLYGNKKIMQ